MIFVAVGTTDFSTLVEAMDNLIPTLAGEEVVMQIGKSQYEPRYCDFFRFAPSLDPYYERASLIVSHGGLGIVTEVMNRQLPLVAVEDVNQPDRHQAELLSVWHDMHHLVWCRDLAQLGAAVEQAKTTLIPYAPPECHIHTVIAEFLEGVDYLQDKIGEK
jgi:UDP-N-acetylglucosamine transferase subunit ALG13